MSGRPTLQARARASTTEPPDIRRSELVALPREAKAQPTGTPSMLVNPDGRIQLNTAAMDRLGTPEDRPRAIRLYGTRDERYLVLERAEPDDPHAIRLFPVGRREDRWPMVHVARAAPLLRLLGITNRARYTLMWDPRRRWFVADLTRPEPVAPGAPRDEIRELLELWAARPDTPREHPLSRRELYRQVVQAAQSAHRQPRLLQRQLAAYIQRHAETLRQELGLEVRGTQSPVYILHGQRGSPTR